VHPLSTPTPPADPAPVGLSAARALTLARRGLFDAFTRAAMGTLVVDREHRIVWISEGYKRFLPALGTDEARFVGRRVEEVIPNTLMAQVVDRGEPILVDLLHNAAGTFVVSRLPLVDDDGSVCGAIGWVLHDRPGETMQPLVAKFARVQQELDTARRALAEQAAAQRRPRWSIASFVGGSEAAVQARRQARRVAATGSTVLLLGETGTGKELLAQAIHAASPRAARPFVAVNIAAVPEGLLEAECFGVAPGAYTGADRKGREGKWKLADGGTLFLDEIGDMPLALQSKLLRVIEEQAVEPLGSNRVERVDVRLVAATSRDLAAMVGQGRFRADLYYRLAVLPIRLPPLRERPADVEALVEALAEDIARRTGLPPRPLAPAALEWLAAQPWPGNVRQLRNALEQATLMSDDAVLEARHFRDALALEGGDTTAPSLVEGAPAVEPARAAPPAVAVPAALAAARPPPPAPTRALRPLAEQVEEVELAALRAALEATRGNRVAAARLLRMSRAALYERLARHPTLAGCGR
jgi:transcriptional regulator with PAS, ATPase and Fis domain